ncbi:MAG: CysB family HTH-type transcriptional regulator [Methylovulum sp.]|uniref:CysB family HTH-type transcriptional regulator n=1 Tax=Methylovulum sp. TaxID=1916980 RepID=UPI0026384C8F|nr:CysB family HTH-type transcriptional regulator [Methylovulum sp.]MDD2723957.1 CysB family HTH-type transcriptional regulator [Methylovulum sp.]MDD5125742.1 CysB family HTH-type transcriptional regulator [Methylovulum sp.]
MKLHQLRYVREIARQNLNISQAAEILHTSQSGISKQIQLLEEELNLHVFERNGKRLTGVTESGKLILTLAERALREIENIKRVSEEFSQKETGSLTLATTHTQARYRLPSAVQAFIQRYPDVKLHIHQGNPTQVAEQVARGEADIGIATEVISSYDKLLCFPCYQWNRCIIAPHSHPLFNDLPLTLEKISQYPLITYDFTFTGGSVVNRVFAEAGLVPNVVLTAIDADVIKTYVNLGLGIGLLANIAFDPERDGGLGIIDASHLFPSSTTYLGLRRDVYLRGYMYELIQLLAPQFDRKAIDAGLQGTAINRICFEAV